MNKKKIIYIILIILTIAVFLIFISKSMTKKSKIGNNMDSQEIVDYILNINSYSAKVDVQINSNKTKNKYILLQEYNTENEYVQEVVEPNNIAGVKIIRKDDNLTIQNTELDLRKIFENYTGLEDNSLDLCNFINDYKINPNSQFEEKNEQIIMKTVSENGNKYNKNKILYIDKKNIIPTKLLIQDNNKNTTIIIEYKEIELN